MQQPFLAVKSDGTSRKIQIDATTTSLAEADCQSLTDNEFGDWLVVVGGDFTTPIKLALQGNLSRLDRLPAALGGVSGSGSAALLRQLAIATVKAAGLSHGRVAVWVLHEEHRDLVPHLLGRGLLRLELVRTEDRDGLIVLYTCPHLGSSAGNEAPGRGLWRAIYFTCYSLFFLGSIWELRLVGVVVLGWLVRKLRHRIAAQRQSGGNGSNGPAV